IVPADVAWSNVIWSDVARSSGGAVIGPPTPPQPPLPASENIERAEAMLRSGLRTALLIAGNGLYGRGLAAAGRIAAATGAKLLAPYPIARLERGIGIASVERMQYVLEQAVEQLREFRQLILVGAPPPVAYFAS